MWKKVISCSSTSVVIALACFAGEKRNFFGTWEPPPALLEFWAPLDNSWWNVDDLRRINAYCADYAKRSDPAKLLPEIMKDLHNMRSADAIVPREGVYIILASHWDKKKVIEILTPYHQSADRDTHALADDFL